jgi:hypothetical protein
LLMTATQPGNLRANSARRISTVEPASEAMA